MIFIYVLSIIFMVRVSWKKKRIKMKVFISFEYNIKYFFFLLYLKLINTSSFP